MKVVIYRHPETGNEVHLYDGPEHADLHKIAIGEGLERIDQKIETDTDDTTGKPLSKMNKAELQIEAISLGIGITSDMTNEAIRKAIADHSSVVE